jgi:hypothetical protein
MIIQLKLNYLSFKKYDRPFTLSINVNKHFQVDSRKDTSKLTAEKVQGVLGLDGCYWIKRFLKYFLFKNIFKRYFFIFFIFIFNTTHEKYQKININLN